MPSFEGSQNVGGNPKRGVDLAVLGFGSGGFADFQDSAVFIFRQNDSDDLVRAELLANGPTRRCELQPARTGARWRRVGGKPARRGRCESVSDPADGGKSAAPSADF